MNASGPQSLKGQLPEREVFAPAYGNAAAQQVQPPEIHRLLDEAFQALDLLEIESLEMSSVLSPVLRPRELVNAAGQSMKSQEPAEPSLSPLGGRINTLAQRMRTVSLRLRTTRDELAI